MAALPPGSVVLDPAQIAVGRTALNLNSGPIRVGPASTGIDFGQAQITAYEAELQKYGSTVVDYRIPNRLVTIPLMLGADYSGTYQTALGQLREKVALLEREGGWLGRSSSSGQNLYADIVNASLTVPDMYGEAAGLENAVSLVLECLPDFYSDTVTLDAITASGSSQTVLTQSGGQAAIQGDYPGRAQLQVADTSGHAQFGLLWGFRSRYYSSASTAGLIYPAWSSMTPAAGASVQTLAGASGGKAITSNSVGSSPTPICSVSFTHLGTYQVWARCYSTTAGMMAQLQWNVGDGSHGLIVGSQVPLPGTGAFYLLNLGQVRLTTPPVGNQQWFCQIDAVGTGAGQNFSLDGLIFVPLDESAGYLEGTVAASDPVMLASQAVQLAYNGVYRAIAGGSVYTPVGLTFGDLPRIPPSGMEGRPVQLLLDPSRGDLESHADSADTDGFTAQVSYRPSFLHKIT